MSKITIGITGGIGSGKSSICKVLETLGYPIFYSDNVGKELLVSDNALKNAIREEFGESVFDGNVIVRSKLGAIVFNNKEKLSVLNKLIHPKVGQAFVKFKQNSTRSLVFKETAILFESNDKSCDFVWSVITDKAERIERVIKRDKVNEDQVLARMNNQFTDEQRISLSDAVIDNNSGSLVIPQILHLISKLETK